MCPPAHQVLQNLGLKDPTAVSIPVLPLPLQTWEPLSASLPQLSLCLPLSLSAGWGEHQPCVCFGGIVAERSWAGPGMHGRAGDRCDSLRVIPCALGP